MGVDTDLCKNIVDCCESLLCYKKRCFSLVVILLLTLRLVPKKGQTLISNSNLKYTIAWTINSMGRKPLILLQKSWPTAVRTVPYLPKRMQKPRKGINISFMNYDAAATRSRKKTCQDSTKVNFHRPTHALSPTKNNGLKIKPQ